LPLIGGLPDFAAYCDAYGDIDKGRHYARYCNAPYHRDVYICTGFGARGMIGAPLAAEIITSQIAGMPAPVEKSVLDALHPARFIIRALKRGQIA
jgi:tRNA 5-methylaminomethyl-2-thiouridine biosynthesis bifunctional protein